MRNKKINMAVVFYGNKNQLSVNNQQFQDLKLLLSSFNLNKYDFNKGGANKLIDDFKKGKIDIVLKNSYGRVNEADIESFLDLHKVPYFGSGPQATFIGTSKFLSKEIFRLIKLPVAKDVLINRILWNQNKLSIIKKIKNNIGFPCIIKDAEGTDSRGIYIIKNYSDFIKKINRIIKKFRLILVEEYIENCYETTCFVAGANKLFAYEPIGIVLGNKFFSGKMKDKHLIQFEIPAKLPKNIIAKIKEVALKAHLALGCNDFSRSDILVKGKKIYLLEVDVHPGFRAKSATVLSLQCCGGSLNNIFFNFYKNKIEKSYGKDKRF
jgi:D-alanine-D-alanine ligase